MLFLANECMHPDDGPTVVRLADWLHTRLHGRQAGWLVGLQAGHKGWILSSTGTPSMRTDDVEPLHSSCLPPPSSHMG